MWDQSDLQNYAAIIGPDGTSSTHVRQAGQERRQCHRCGSPTTSARPSLLWFCATYHLAAVSCISTGWSRCIIRTKTCKSGSPTTNTANKRGEEERRGQAVI